MQTTHNFTLPCQLLITAKVLVHFSLASTLSIFGSVKTAWSWIQMNQLLFCLAHYKVSDLCLGFNLSMRLVQSSHCQTKSRSLMPKLMPTLLWRLILRLYQVPAFTTFVLSGKFVHRWMIARLSLLHLHSFLRDWITWTLGLSCTALCWSTQLAFNDSSMQQLGLSCTSILVHLHCLQMNSSNNSTGFLIEWRIRFKLATLTFKALHSGRPPYLSDLLQYHESTRSLRSSSTHQLSVPRYNLTFGSHAFRFSAPRVWNSLPISIRESQSLPTFRRHLKTFYFQSAYPLQCPPCLEYPRPRALILLRLWRCISHLLTYLLT